MIKIISTYSFLLKTTRKLMNLWNGRIYLRFWLENKANCEFDFWFIENCKFTMKIKSKPILNRYSMLSPNSKINIEKKFVSSLEYHS